MTRGRRPAGICGAALLLAARMNNFRRSVEEIIQVVKIADTTLRKRLDEFKNTPSGSLTLADFRNVWLEEEMDPPAFIKGKEREDAERSNAPETGDQWDPNDQGKKKGKKRKKRKRKKGGDTDEEALAEDQEPPEQTSACHNGPTPIDPALLNEGIFEGTFNHVPLFIPDAEDSNYNIDPVLLQRPHPLQHPQHRIQHPFLPPLPPPPAKRSLDDGHSTLLTPPPTSAVDETVSTVLAEEVSTFLNNSQGALLSGALDEAEERRLAQIIVEDELLGLDEEELDRFLLTEEEVKIKERVWVELNRDYLEAIAGQFVLRCLL